MTRLNPELKLKMFGLLFVFDPRPSSALALTLLHSTSLEDCLVPVPCVRATLLCPSTSTKMLCTHPAIAPARRFCTSSRPYSCCLRIHDTRRNTIPRNTMTRLNPQIKLKMFIPGFSRAQKWKPCETLDLLHQRGDTQMVALQAVCKKGGGRKASRTKTRRTERN